MHDLGGKEFMDNNQNQNTQNHNDVKSLDELLKDPTLQAEFDKKVAKALEKNAEKLKEEWEEKAKADRTEAERLAKLTEAEKQKELLDKANKGKLEAENKLKAYELKEEAFKIAKGKNLDTDLLSTIDFTVETADSIKTKIDSLETVFNKAVESTVKSKLKQSSPYNVGATLKNDEKAYLDKKYGNSKYYKGV